MLLIIIKLHHNFWSDINQEKHFSFHLLPALSNFTKQCSTYINGKLKLISQLCFFISTFFMIIIETEFDRK